MASSADHLRSVLLYGTPNTVAFIVVHSAIYGLQLYFPQQCGNFSNSKEAIKRGQYHRWFTSNFMHADLNHLWQCTIAFTPHCYRLIHCIDATNKKRSMRIFWSLYLASGFLGCFVAHIFENSYKRYLLYYFKNNNKIIHDITIRYDSLNKFNKESIGASGAIFSLYAFNSLISMEMILKRFHFVYKLFFDESDGLIDISDDINMKYDILDYDVQIETAEGHTARGEITEEVDIDVDEFNEGHIDEATDKRVKHQTLKLFVDVFWMLYSGYKASEAALDLCRLWKLAKQERGGQNIMKLQSDLYRINFIGHFSGSVAGLLIYVFYKLFTSPAKQIERGETSADEDSQINRQTPQ